MRLRREPPEVTHLRKNGQTEQQLVRRAGNRRVVQFS
jgi:hypothetical protein